MNLPSLLASLVGLGVVAYLVEVYLPVPKLAKEGAAVVIALCAVLVLLAIFGYGPLHQAPLIAHRSR